MKEPVILCCARVIKGQLLLPDNKTGPCAVCGHVVQYRPHAPKPFILRCMQCAADLIEPDDEIITTKEMLDDAAEFFRKQKH